VRRRRLGILLVVGGSALALALQVGAPVGVPLYDGVAVVEPYRYLEPQGNQVGPATSYSDSKAVLEGVSPVVTAATLESPPQAQLIAQRGAFELTAGALTLVAKITPIDPPGQPEAGSILGNVYRFSVTDDSGTELRITPCDGCVSLVLRAPEGGPPATIMQFVGGAWKPLETRHAGTVALYQTNPRSTGTFAVVATGESQGGGVDLVLLLAIGGIALIFIAFVALLYLRARPAPLPAAKFPRTGPAGPSLRVPSKRRGSKRPASGRSDR
jgi:hypothetical protein